MWFAKEGDLPGPLGFNSAFLPLSEMNRSIKPSGLSGVRWRRVIAATSAVLLMLAFTAQSFAETCAGKKGARIFILPPLLEEKQAQTVCRNSTNLIANQHTPFVETARLFPKQRMLLD